jgi:hypothetical protein
MDSKFQDDAIEAWLCFVCAVVICTFAALLLILSALYSFRYTIRVCTITFSRCFIVVIVQTVIT